MNTNSTTTINEINTIELFSEKYPSSYDALSYEFYMLTRYGSVEDMIGSSDPDDLADWLSDKTGVELAIAKLFVKLYL